MHKNDFLVSFVGDATFTKYLIIVLCVQKVLPREKLLCSVNIGNIFLKIMNIFIDVNIILAFIIVVLIHISFLVICIACDSFFLILPYCFSYVFIIVCSLLSYIPIIIVLYFCHLSFLTNKLFLK